MRRELLLDTDPGEFEVDMIIQKLRRVRNPAHHIGHAITVDRQIRGGYLGTATKQGHCSQGQDETGIEETKRFQVGKHGFQLERRSGPKDESFRG